jgi:glycosyltransferase involved in cell wall biosynthesis
LVVGRGPHREKLRRYARRRGAAVELLDPQPRPDYLRLLAGARYAVNPSRLEAYSVFAAEALAMAVPTITTPEVAENLQAEAEPFRVGLVAIKHAPILPWNQIIPKYLALYEDSAN